MKAKLHGVMLLFLLYSNLQCWQLGKANKLNQLQLMWTTAGLIRMSCAKRAAETLL